MEKRPDSGVLLISEELYRLLLGLYPRHYRDQFGLHMSRTFRDSCREQYQRLGMVGLIGYWLFTAMDVIKIALEERAHKGEFVMSKETLIRIGAVAMITGGGLSVLASPTMFGKVGEIGGYAMTHLLILIGFIGLAVNAGPGSRAWAWLAVAACSGATLSLVVIPLVGKHYDDRWWEFLLLALPATIISVGIYGIANLREKRLPRWNAAPLIAAVTTAVALLLPWKAAVWMPSIQWALEGFSWMLLGVAMLPKRSPAIEAVQM